MSHSSSNDISRVESMGDKKSDHEQSADPSMLKTGDQVKAGDSKKSKEEKKEEFRPALPPEPLATWRKVLKDVWIGESKNIKVELCETILTNIFIVSNNLFEDILLLHKICPDYSTQKMSTLAGFVMQYFAQWLNKCDRSELYERYLTRQLQMEALETAVVKHTTHLRTIADIYKLKVKEMMTPACNAVKRLLELKNYRDAINCAAVFDLQEEIPIEQIVVPCLLQNGYLAIEAYLKDRRDLQIELVRFFDNFVGMDNAKMRERVRCLHESGLLPMSQMKMQSKTLEKLVAKLISIYGLRGDEAAPNLARCRQEGSLRYVVSKHFIEGTMSEESYTDYVSHALKDDQHLQHYFVKHLYRIGEIDDAVRWVVHCKMNTNIPHSVRAIMDQTRIQSAEEKISRLRERRKDMVDVNLFDGHPVIMVDTIMSLRRLIGVFETASIIGIDTEWKPMFLSTVEQVALLQVSTRSCSYLVDVIKLEEEIGEEEWMEFFKALFCTESSMKLGFDFANDMRVLRASFPFLESMQPDMKNVICIMKLATSLISENSASLDLPVDEAHGSASNENTADELPSDEQQLHFKLADLYYRLLGERLDKREQIGNWAVRPLRREQMKYAAMDAYCLIRIYDRMKVRATEEFGMNWQTHLEMSDVIQVKPKQPKKGKKKATRVDDNELQQMMERVNAAVDESTANGQRPSDVKVIVDSMMFGLGKHLRRCGIDTILAETRDSLVECAKRERERYILTSGKAYNELLRNRALCASNRILCVPAVQTMNAIEQIEYVLKYFHIKLHKEDIFSRCMICNAQSFVIGPAPILEAMYQANVIALLPFNEQPYNADKYNQKILEVNGDDYSGYGCSLTINEDDKSWATARCYNGILDIRNCLVLASNCDAPSVVQIEKVPLPVLEKEGRFFYVCGQCGKVYWDGCHIVNYNTFAEPLFANETAEESTIVCDEIGMN
uniref:3'-5' exonuclease domain-containing protein n=2 Tax=Parascaris univalens TaxID=6257 RepID=A0A915B1V5_PARUN